MSIEIWDSLARLIPARAVSIRIIIFAVFLGLFAYYQVGLRGFLGARIIDHEISAIVRILEKIDKDAAIVSIDTSHDAELDIFQTESLKRAKIGPLTVEYPENWKGPYANRTARYRGECYQIVRARDGYFVIPGDGVTLPNGLTVGKDIVINDEQDAAPFLRDGGMLRYAARYLARPLTFSVGDWVVDDASSFIRQMIRAFK